MDIKKHPLNEESPSPSSLKGKKYIDELRRNAGVTIHPNTLYSLYNVQKIKYIEDDYRDEYYEPLLGVYIVNNPEPGIPMTDKKTIDAIKKEVKAITYALDQALINNDLGKIEDYQDQLDKYQTYISECTTPRGKIRETESLTRKCIAAIYRAVEYYYQSLEKTDPKLAQYYSEHVVIGNPCYWSEEPIKRKKQKMA